MKVKKREATDEEIPPGYAHVLTISVNKSGDTTISWNTNIGSFLSNEAIDKICEMLRETAYNIRPDLRPQ